MKKRYIVYAFLAGVLLTSAVCVRIMKAVTLYVDCAKVVEQCDKYVTINFYHSNTDRHYLVRVPIADIPVNGDGAISVSAVTTKLWSADDRYTTDALFGESALDLATDLYISKPEWSIPEDQLQNK